jgi:hypothetical protein
MNNVIWLYQLCVYFRCIKNIHMTTKSGIAAITIFSFLLIASCSKVKTDTNADPNAKQHNEDVSNTKTESDNVNTDVNLLLREISGFGKREAGEAISICGATIDSSHQFDPVPMVIITFDGTTVCGSPSRKRSGEIKVELIQGNKWSDQGAKLKVTHTNYKVTFVTLNNHYVTFNGIKYLTNLTGFDWFTYLFSGSLTATIKERSDNMLVTFENGQEASWNSARLSTWEITGYSTIVATVNGDSINGNKTIDSWGVTRFGTAFTTEMVTPWKSGTACGWWKPTQGKYTSTTDNFTVTATFGVDNNGNPASGCPGYFKLGWTILSSGTSGEAVIGYW